MQQKQDPTEKTPLVQSCGEDIHPLPWFRSPETTQQSNNTRTYHQFKAKQTWGDYLFGIVSCCYPTTNQHEEQDLEIGNTMVENETYFRRCIQFLIGMIVLIAIGLLLMIFLHPIEGIK